MLRTLCVFFLVAIAAPARATSDAGDAGDKRWSFGAGLAYSGASKLNFANTTINSAVTSYVFNTADAWTMSVEAKYHLSASLGLQGGVSADTNRYLKDSSYSISGTTTNDEFTSPEPKISLVTPYLNLNYAWGAFYIFGGPNYSLVGIQNPPLILKELHGGPGGQAGIGWLFFDRVAVEASGRLVTFQAKSQTDAVTGANIEGKTGYLVTGALGVKVYY